LVSGVWVLLLFVAVFGVVLNVPVVWGSGTIYIRADGSIEPPTAPITSLDNVTYTFTDNINDSIVIERDNIIVDGAGYILRGSGTFDSKGVELSNRSNITVKSVRIQEFYFGIYLSSSSNNVIWGNSITNSSNLGYGIWLESSSYNFLLENTLTNNYDGILLCESSNNNVISGNIITSGYNGGLGLVYSSNNNTVSRNNITNYGWWGVWLSESSNHNTFFGNNIENTDGIGIFYSSYNNVFENEIKNNSDQGVGLYISPNNNITKNSITNNYQGIGLFLSSDGNTISENIIANNGEGVSLFSSLNVFYGNMIASNNGDGVWTSGSFYNNSFVKNIIANNDGYGIYGYSEGNFLENTITNNTGGGLSLGSNMTVYANTIVANNGYGIELRGSSNIISGNNITKNNNDGIYALSSGNIFSNNTLKWNKSGIHFDGPIHDTIVFNNTIVSNQEDGISLQVSFAFDPSNISNIVFWFNVISFNNGNGINLNNTAWYASNSITNVSFLSNMVLSNSEDGIYLFSYGNQGYIYNVNVSSNTVSSNGENGVHVKADNHSTQLTYDLTISKNIISGNEQEGIWIEGRINANLSRNSISYNTYGVLYTQTASNLAENNDIYRNSYGMNVTDGAEVDAEDNYWGDMSGPYHEILNINGTGNPVNGNGVDLDFIPFLTDPIGQINERPVAVLTADETRVKTNQIVTFNASASTDDGQITHYFFDFGDGTNSSWTTSPVITHKYISQGTCNATLIVTDNFGVTSLYSDLTRVTITVIAPPVANFTYAPELPLADSLVTFNASSSYDQDGTIVSYRWDFDDGNITTTTDPIITHVYTAQSTYNVSLTVTDNDGLNNSITISITVTKDSTPPMTTHDYDGLWHTSDFTITLTATDDLSNVAETYYRINDGPIQNASTHGQPFITTEGANNKLEYWSADNAGNEESHHVLTGIKLDKTAPTIDIPSREPIDDVQPDQPVKISVNVTDITSQVKNVTLYYSLNNGTTWEQPIPMTLNYSTSLHEATIPGQEAGTWVKYKITAYDYAGNNATIDGTQPYCVYQVIPEFPSTTLLTLFMITTLFATILLRRKRHSKSQQLFC
jgi:parallel beta-helix repeat protein